MRAADLDIHELLHFLPEGGIITFAGERVLLLDAVALGLLQTGAHRDARRDGGARRAHEVRVCARMARRRNAAQGIPVGQRRRMENRRRAAAHDSGSRARGGDARLAQRRRARRRRHLARLVRGRATSAASRPGGRAGVLDADGLRQWLHVLRLRQGDHRDRRSLPGQGRCGLSRGRPLKRGVGAGTRHASAVLSEGLPGFGADAADRHAQEEGTAAPVPSRAATGRSRRRLPVLSARVRRCFGRSIWRGASRRSTRPS